MDKDRYIYLPSPMGLLAFAVPPKREFTLRVELSPSGIFGIESPPALTIPTEKGAVEEERLNPDFVFSPKTQSREDPNRGPLKMEWKGLAIERQGNILKIRAKGVNLQRMALELEQILRHILENLTLRIGEPLRYRILSATDDQGNSIPLPPVKSRSISFYDNDLMDSDLQASVRSLELRDETYDQAIYYYLAGCRFRDLWTGHANRRVEFGNSEHDFEDTLWSCGFLQFWKSITAILEEPVSHGKRKGIFGGRVKALDLPQHIQVLLKQLENIRNDFDVSHRAYDRFSRVASMRNFEVARHVASKVLLAYQERLAKGKPGFGPSPMEVYRLRKEKGNPLRRLAKAPRRRIAHYTLTVENPNWETGPRIVTGARSAIVTLRIPLGKQPGHDSAAEGDGQA